MAKSAIPRSSTVAQALLQRITAEELPAGSMLPTERELQETFNVSRPVVREAIKWLAARGLVSIKAGQGVVVGGDLTTPAAEALLLAFHRAQVRTEDMLSTDSSLSRTLPPCAAVNASPLEIRRLQRYAETMEATTFVDGIHPRQGYTVGHNGLTLSCVARTGQPESGACRVDRSHRRHPVAPAPDRESTCHGGAARRGVAPAHGNCRSCGGAGPERARQAMLEHLQSTSANFGSLTLGTSAIWWTRCPERTPPFGEAPMSTITATHPQPPAILGAGPARD
jgi:DNA-binding FadR family transcriptional regulator